jgi:hypothetical protein
MEKDHQPVISLRPGGGGGGPRPGRLFSPAFAAAASGSGDLLRSHVGGASKIGDPNFEVRERVRYTRDQLLELREIVDIPEAILRINQEIDIELHGEDQIWGRPESDVSSCYFRCHHNSLGFTIRINQSYQLVWLKHTILSQIVVFCCSGASADTNPGATAQSVW